MSTDETTELKNWLKESDNEQYLDTFVENGISMEIIPQLDNQALKELGILKVGDRIRIQLQVEKVIARQLEKQVPIEKLVDTITSSTNALELNGPSQTINRSTSALTLSPELFSDVKITVIAQDGSTAVVDVSDCYSSSAIKRKALKRIGVLKPNVDNWTSYVVKNARAPYNLRDEELVSLCHSTDNEEKNRIILCFQYERPSQMALATSKNIQEEQGDDSPRDMRSIMGQRPPSQLISANLAEYFPESKANELKNIIRNSVRLSMYSTKSSVFSGGVMSSGQSIYSSFSKGRMSMVSSAFSVGVGVSASAPTLGDVILNNSQAVDTILSGDSDEYKTAMGVEDLTSTVSISTEQKRMSRMSVAEELDDAATSIVDLFEEEDIEEEEEELERQLSMQNENLVWQKGSRIGQGSFGTVYLGLNGLTGELMAVKEVELRTSSSESSKARMIAALKQEMRLLKDLNHENIVRYLGSSSDADHLYIFLEYIPGGSVASMLNTYGPFEEPLIRNFITQTLVGLHYLHNMGIVHRDVKGANILIDINGTVKISDFGISKKNTDEEEKAEKEAQQDKKNKRASLQGSVYWMAPEVVKQIAYTEAADIWSVGCLIVEMFTGSHPYPGFSQMQAIFRIGTSSTPDIPETATKVAREFLSLTFEIDYKKRSSAATLLKHPFTIPLIAFKGK